MSRLLRFTVYSGLCWLPLQAGTILSVGGNTSAFFNLGPAQALASSLTTTSSYRDVSFFATLFNNGSSDVSGVAFLTTALGPAATSSSLVDQAPFTIGAGAAAIELFFEPLLKPGTYYLVLTAATPASDFGWLYTRFPTLVAGPGVTEGQRFYADPAFNSSTSFNPAFPPGSRFVNLDVPSNRLLIDVIAADVPEPGTALLLVFVAILFLVPNRFERANHD